MTTIKKEDISLSLTNSTNKIYSIKYKKKPLFSSQKVKSKLKIKKEKKRLRKSLIYSKIIIQSLSTNSFDSDIILSLSKIISLLDSTNNSDILNLSYYFNSKELIFIFDMIDINLDNKIEYFTQLKKIANSLVIDFTILVDI